MTAFSRIVGVRAVLEENLNQKVEVLNFVPSLSIMMISTRSTIITTLSRRESGSICTITDSVFSTRLSSVTNTDTHFESSARSEFSVAALNMIV